MKYSGGTIFVSCVGGSIRLVCAFCVTGLCRRGMLAQRHSWRCEWLLTLAQGTPRAGTSGEAREEFQTQWPHCCWEAKLSSDSYFRHISFEKDALGIAFKLSGETTAPLSRVHPMSALRISWLMPYIIVREHFIRFLLRTESISK
jgi:hypothetical protein